MKTEEFIDKWEDMIPEFYHVEFKEDIESAISEHEAGKTFEIDFAGNAKAKINIKNNVPVIEASMDGWGNRINPKDVQIVELPKPYEPKEGGEG